MRVAPVGLLYYENVERLREVAQKSAQITHTHELGKEGAAIQAYAVSLALKMETDKFEPKTFLDEVICFTRNEAYKEKLEEAKALLDLEDRGSVLKRLGNTVEALNSVPTAIYCFANNHQDYTKTVLYALSLGGDTDTIGAMAGAIAGAYHGREGLPRSWKCKLEEVNYIEKLARELWKLKNAQNI